MKKSEVREKKSSCSIWADTDTQFDLMFLKQWHLDIFMNDLSEQINRIE